MMVLQSPLDLIQKEITPKIVIIEETILEEEAEVVVEEEEIPYLEKLLLLKVDHLRAI